MQHSNVWSASKLVSERVRNRAGQDIGRIEDLVIDQNSGNVQYAIVSFDGFGRSDDLFAIPWSELTVSPARDYLIADFDNERLGRAPFFRRGAWPDMADPAWRRDIDGYYGHSRPADWERPRVYEDRLYEDRRPVRRGWPVVAIVLLIGLILGLAWMTYMVSTRGWDQARQDIKGSLQSAVYAAKETSETAALTTKVKTALSLSKRIPADTINVDSQDGVVTLRGEVPSAETKALAESVTRDVPGVSQVNNHLFIVTRSQ
jgi:sporulation protein YlmC with PRC-barrel domain